MPLYTISYLNAFIYYIKVLEAWFVYRSIYKGRKNKLT